MVFVAPSYAEEAQESGDVSSTIIHNIELSLYAGTPLAMGGSVGSSGEFSSRQGPGSGWEVGSVASYPLLQKGDWTFGIAGGFWHQYLKTAISDSKSGGTEGSVTTYAPGFGGFAEYQFDKDWSGRATSLVGPAYVDFHDQRSNGNSWAFSPRVILEAAYCFHNQSSVCAGPYMSGWGVLPLNAKGEPGGRNVSGGSMYGGTVGLTIRF